MKVLFVYTRETPQSPVKPLVDLEAVQFGISYISAYLKAHGHQTRLLVMTRTSDFADVDRLVREFEPELVCLTAVASEYLFVERIGRYLRKGYPNLYQLLGGVHASLRPEDAMLDVFNALCVGEGEHPTLELIAQLESGATPSGIANLWIKQGDRIEKNPPREFLGDLDAVPFADREMWEEWIDWERSPMRPSLLLGRGCPFLCTYCCNHSLRKLAPGRYVRLRSPAGVIAEIESILQRLPKVAEIYFEVETFGANLEWTLELCEALVQFNAARPTPLRFGGNLRITPALSPKVDDLFAALRRANFRSVNIGLESGSPRLRSEVLRRNYANEDIIRAAEAARKHGLDFIFFNLIGLPTETIEDLNQTIEVNRICRPNYHYLSIFYPYPGTDLHTLCETSGWLPKNLLAAERERIRAALDYPTLRRTQIDKAFLWFDTYAFGDASSGDWRIERLCYMYRLAYASSARMLLAMTRDVLRPSLRLRPGVPEFRIYRNVLSKEIRLFIHTKTAKIRPAIRIITWPARRVLSPVRRIAGAAVRRLAAVAKSL